MGEGQGSKLWVGLRQRFTLIGVSDGYVSGPDFLMVLPRCYIAGNPTG